MGDKLILFCDKDGNFVLVVDVWNVEKLEEFFNILNFNCKFCLECEKLVKEKRIVK